MSQRCREKLRLVERRDNDGNFRRRSGGGHASACSPIVTRVTRCHFGLRTRAIRTMKNGMRIARRDAEARRVEAKRAAQRASAHPSGNFSRLSESASPPHSLRLCASAPLR
jgi:hypothetical protein